MPTHIESLQNPRVKSIRDLSTRKRARDRDGHFVVEGERELARCRAAGIEITNFYICPELFKHSDQSEDLHEELLNSDVPLSYLTESVFKHCSYRDNPDGFIAIAKTFESPLEKLKLSDKPLILILEALEKPGNLGTILRTADAVGVDALIITDPVTDLFNPNVIRASAGVVFKVPTAVASSEGTLSWLKTNNIQAIATTPDTDTLYYDADLTQSTAIIMGSEKDGLSDTWLSSSTQKVKLPMHGQADSLNVGAATAAVLYEAVRQRRT